MKTESTPKKVISVKKTLHRKKVVLLLTFKYDDVIINHIRSLKKFTWSKTLQGWVSPFTDKTFSDIQHLLSDIADIKVDESVTKKLYHRGVKTERKLTSANKEIIRNYVKYLRGKRYSESTVLTYFTFIADFIDFSQPAPIESLTNKNVELFIEAIFITRNYSISSQRQFISALKLFVVYYPKCNIESLTLERPKTSRKLPSVLSQQEVVTLLQVTKNLKHRAILAMLYSAGLRIGELTKLELRHIDVTRRQLFVQNGKGRKDRYVILADSFLPLLQNYISTYVPKRFFVESPTGTKYSESSIRKFLHTSTRLANIKKHVTPHTLRHSYATHLLENGIGLRHIQELLGHAKPETTMIYTHVAKKDLLEIKSPLDTILLSLQKNTSESDQFLNSRKV
ncbi:tyrosine-type recombinase/integrase [Tenacibaculum sp. HL-MS23]|uniref:tyrosine-type recombinase/integrase n=1 Tax=unclassified Tenacibaculum TaxID=2635139 RepID=UPI001C4F149F|nr:MULTISPECIES: tyrosine-type recombinase/integrase [unclassified Tenacibaculum]QXP74648.1 tyrosine-type recombinase/integrase [Tenacibaculum sp. AHE14PA]QXP76159.1 tyrosine-type recombinase/integrase [Tenacibaculum sp. AHE15PA]WNW02737.1 tyrosine-type recombinase/integrase [Tenacibaculum sp. HL-MS23]